ncbi:MAG: TerC family protein [Eggerthellaceae bacterium]|nr:TerC family protein [Eggerthellaceae bacterium]
MIEILAIFTTPEAWISLITLIFLEIILGVDNLVFISITSSRLPEEKQHLGRKLGLAGALFMRILFLCFASYLASMVEPLFSIPFGESTFDVSVHDIIMFAGGIYLIYKGIKELVDVIRLTDVVAEDTHDMSLSRKIGLPQAVGTIMIMDIVFSIDSVITAVGLAQYLIIMILAVMIAVFIMMAFIDPIADFINHHVEMKILALFFITVIGILLLSEGLHINSGIVVLDMYVEKLMVYFAMIFSFVIQLIQMRYNKNLRRYQIDGPKDIDD